MEEQNPLVSIIIPCFNYGKYITETILSAYSSYYEPIEVIIVDDGSDDRDTLSVLEELKGSHPQAIQIRQSNKGLPGARNTGIRAAKGKYILPLDADDLIDPSYISKAVWHLEIDDNLSFIYPLVQLFGQSNEVWVTKKFNSDLLLHHNYVPAAAVFRRSLWETLGGYDESMRLGYEDWEFWIRSVNEGHYGLRLEEKLFYYRQHEKSMLKGSRQKHIQLVDAIRNKHKHLYSAKWKMRVLRYYALQKVKKIPTKALTFVKGQKLSRLRNSMSRLKHNQSMSNVMTNRRGADSAVLHVANTKHDHSTLYILPWLDVGGVEKVFLQLLQYLNRDLIGNRYIMTTNKHEHPWHAEFSKVSEGIYHLPFFCSDEEEMLLFIRNFVESNQVQNIHISNSRFGYRSIASLKSFFPHLNMLDTLHMEEPYKPWDYFKVSQESGKALDSRVVLTEYQKNRLLTVYGEQESRITIIPNGVDITSFPEDRNRMQIAFIGRLVDQKRPDFFLKIAKGLVDEGVTAPILIIGSGPLERELKKQCDKLGLSSSVQFLGAIDQVAQYMQDKVRVLVAPSKVEGLPVTGLEAMAAGTLIVASKVPGWSDMIDDRIDGFLIDGDDIRQWTTRICEALESTPSNKAVIERAYVKVNNHYSIPEMCRRYERLYL